jgi:S-adenosylmethionine-dependent methyltransferase
MKADRDRIRAYYAQGLEDGRLASDDGWFELERTVRIVKGLVPAGSRVVDLGGGPGRLTVALAREGYRMTLVDLSPVHVEQARQRVAAEGVEVEDLRVGDAGELDGIGPFDAVVSFGPLYHVGSYEELVAMARAHVALTRPGGAVIGSFLPRASGVAGLIARAASTPDQVPPGALRAAWDTGRFANTSTRGFCETWFAEPAQIVEAFTQAGLADPRVQSIRGIAAPYGAALRKIRDTRPEVYEEIVALVEESADDPELVATAWHAVVLGRRPVG